MRTGVGVQTRLLLPDRPYNAASRHRRVIGRCHRQHVYSQSSNSSPVGPVDHNAGRLSQVASPRAPLPYASLSVPVYSLVTRGSHDGSRNATMNLVTYAIPVSIEPRQFQICLLRSTLSFENFVHNGEGVLQVRIYLDLAVKI